MKRIAAFEKVSYAVYAGAYAKWLSCADDLRIRSSFCLLKLPERATAGSAGYDFYSPADLTISPGESVTVPTGIRAKIDEGWVLLIFPRSGLGFRYRLQLANTVGVIDSDYYGSDNEGHIMIRITNDSKEGKTVTIEEGSAFAQGIFLPYGITVGDETDRERNGGFGSTG